MPLSMFVKPHPSTWMEETRALLLEKLLLPTTKFPSVISTFQIRTNPLDPTNIPGYEFAQAKAVATAFYTLYPRSRIAPREHLILDEGHFWLFATEKGLLGKTILNQEISEQEMMAYQVGLVLREMAIEALTLFLPSRTLNRKLDVQPVFEVRQDELHDYLANAGYYFYHMEGMQLERYTVGYQTDLFLSPKKELLQSLGVSSSTDPPKQTE